MIDERKYYCICEDNCKFETMTKEQIIAFVANAIATGSVGDCDTGFVTRLKETNSGGYVTLWVGTRAQYEKIEEEVPNCIYIITDDTTTEDIWNTFATMQKDIDTAARQCAGRAPWELVTVKEICFSTMEALDVYVKNTAAAMQLYAVTIISCRLDMDDFSCGAQITIHKGADCDGLANARVHFQTDDGTAMQRFAWSDGAESQLNWEAWEYINPPMLDGVEYRTAERHNGKPVYAKTRSIEMGDEGETRSMLITSDATADFQVVSMDAVIKPPSNNYPWSTFPAFNQHDGSIAATCDISVEETEYGTYQVFADVRSFVTMLHNVATVTVKYTK